MWIGLYEMYGGRKEDKNIGRLFLYCTRDCGYFKWNNDLPSLQETPLQFDGESIVKLKTKDPLEDLLSTLKTPSSLRKNNWRYPST